MGMKNSERQFSQDQYDMLKRCSDAKDITEWNQWRKANPAALILLEGADLNRMNLEGAVLEGTVLDRANLEGANLKGANLEGTELREANLRGANLKEVNLMGAHLFKANLQKANLVKAFLFKANLSGADLRRADLTEASLKDAELRGADLRWAKYRRAFISLSKANSAITSQNHKFLPHEPFTSNRIKQYVQITRLVMSSTGDYDATDMKPLWLMFSGTVSTRNIAISLSVIDNLSALIRVFHRESSEIPVYASSLAESPWGEKERQELEDRLTKAFADPVAALLPEERLYLHRVVEGSLHLGLGEVPKWIWDKLSKIWEFFPDLIEAKAKAAKYYAEAERKRAESERIREEAKTVGPKSEAQIEQEWEKVYKMQQARVLDGMERRFAIMKGILDRVSPEYKKLPPKAVLMFMNKLFSTLDDASEASDLGTLLSDDVIKKLPPIDVEGSGKDDVEMV